MEPDELTFPVQVTFHGVRRSPELEAEARAHVGHLVRFHSRIHGVRVVIGKAEGHAKQGRYHVQLRVSVPGNDVVVGQHPPRTEHDDPSRALTDAFRAVERRLEDQSNVRQGKVKSRAAAEVQEPEAHATD